MKKKDTKGEKETELTGTLCLSMEGDSEEDCFTSLAHTNPSAPHVNICLLLLLLLITIIDYYSLLLSFFKKMNTINSSIMYKQ